MSDLVAGAIGMYLMTGFYTGLLIVIASQITESDQMGVLDTVVTLLVHCLLWPKTLFMLIDDVFSD